MILLSEIFVTFSVHIEEYGFFAYNKVVLVSLIGKSDYSDIAARWFIFCLHNFYY